jgi:hypothetical protein
MSATTAGALKAFLEGAGLGVPVYRDGAPTGSRPPYIAITEGIGYAPRLDGDTADPAAVRTVTEAVQVDLVQPGRVPAGAGAAVSESYTLPGQLARALHTARLPAAPTRVYGVRVSAGRRWPPAGNVVRHTYDVIVERVL